MRRARSVTVAAEGGEPHAAREALEEPAAAAALEPRDIAGQRRLGDGEAFGGRGDASRLVDGKEANEVGSLLEHGDVPRWWGAGRMSLTGTCGVGSAVFTPPLAV